MRVDTFVSRNLWFKHLGVDGLPLLSAALLLGVCLSTAAVDLLPPDSIDIEPGMSVERVFGPASFVIRVDRIFAQVEVDVELTGRRLAERTMTPAANTSTFDLSNGDAAIRGSLAVQFAYPEERSALVGDFEVVNGQCKTSFRGDVVAWHTPNSLILKRQRIWLTPELCAETDIMLDTSESILVRLVTGTQIIHTITLSQGANDAVADDGFAVGTVRIEPGLSLHLQPATPTQEGEVLLKGVFGSSNHPEVKYTGAIATWSYIQPQAKTKEK